MADDEIIPGFEMDIPPDEHVIRIKLPGGWRVEVETGGVKIEIRGGECPSVEMTSSPGQWFSISAYHLSDEGETAIVKALPRKEREEQPRKTRWPYRDGDIVGHNVLLSNGTSQLLCSDCWMKAQVGLATLDYTFADTAEFELICDGCHLQLPTRGEP